MGAEYWERLIGDEPDPDSALRRLQAEDFRDRDVDLADLLATRVEDMRRAVSACESDDPYDLLDHYQDALDRFRRLAAQGIPPEIDAQIALLRRIEALGSDGAPGILAFEGWADEPAYFRVYLVPGRAIGALCGSARPTLREARKGVERLVGLDRGMAVCLPVFEGGRQVAWYFAGYSAD